MNIKAYLISEKTVALNLIEQCDYALKALDDNTLLTKPMPEVCQPMEGYFKDCLIPLVKREAKLAPIIKEATKEVVVEEKEAPPKDCSCILF